MTARAPAAFAAACLLALASAARAQTVPEGQSCGGLLCDMGVLGHKTEPAVAPPPPAPAAAQPAAALADPRPAAAPPAARPRPPRPRAHAVAARRPAATPREVTTPREADAPRVVAAPPRMPAPPPPARAQAPARAAAPAAVARPAIAPPTAPTTAMQMPAPRRRMFYFQSVDPTLQ